MSLTRHHSDIETSSRKDLPRSLPRVNAAASLALGRLQVLELFPAPSNPFLFPVHSPHFQPPSPLVLRTLAFLSCLFLGLTRVKCWAGLGWAGGCGCSWQRKRESRPWEHLGLGCRHQSGPGGLAASLQPSTSPSRLGSASASPERLGEAKLMMSMSVLDEKPQKASLAFRNEERIPSPGLRGPAVRAHQPPPRVCSQVSVPCHCRSFRFLLTQCSSPPSLPLLRPSRLGPGLALGICSHLGSMLPKRGGWACLSYCHSHSRRQCLARSRGSAAGPPTASPVAGAGADSVSSLDFSLRPCCLFAALDA